MPHHTAKNSMRLRLILIPSGILAVAIIAAIAMTLHDARARIASEIESGLTLGGLLIGYALDDLAAADNRDAVAQSAALLRLRDGLAQVRHIRVSYLARPQASDPPPPDIAKPTWSAPESRAPDWFLHLFEPAHIKKTFSVFIGGMRQGDLVMSSEPADEVAEIWRGLVFLTALLTLISIAIVALILLTARHTLAPIHQLVEGLDRLGRGKFDAVGEISIAELRRVGEHFNRLAGTLARAEADNHLLIDRLMSVQDAERKELARELHDEFGALLFGIRAAASCIVEAASSGLADFEQRRDIIGRAQTISALADSIQKQNYRILERIRPVILHQMGLTDALHHLVESWRAQHPDFDCSIEFSSQRWCFDEEVSLTIYRIVQECLTNVARHSNCKFVRVAMEECCGEPLQPDAAAPMIRLSIEDDGVGLAPEFKFGFGFLGMSERVRKLGGHLKIRNGVRAGAAIEASIPIGEPPPSTARHAEHNLSDHAAAETSAGT